MRWMVGTVLIVGLALTPVVFDDAISRPVAAQSAAALAQNDDPQGPSADDPATHVVGHNTFIGGLISYKRVETFRLPQTTQSTTFVNLANAVTFVPVFPGRTALINVRFHAETRCNEPGGVGEQNWCEARIVIGGIEGFPQASSFPADTFALDSTNNGAESVASWEGHAMERHRCVRNPSTTSTINIPIVVQWKVTNFGNDLDRPLFWVDDWSLVAERSDNCSPVF